MCQQSDASESLESRPIIDKATAKRIPSPELNSLNKSVDSN